MQRIELIDGENKVLIDVPSDVPFNVVERDIGDLFTFSHTYTQTGTRQPVRVYRRPALLDLMSDSIVAVGNDPEPKVLAEEVNWLFTDTETVTTDG